MLAVGRLEFSTHCEAYFTFKNGVFCDLGNSLEAMRPFLQLTGGFLLDG